MSLADGLVAELRSTQKFFKTTLSVLDSADEAYALENGSVLNRAELDSLSS